MTKLEKAISEYLRKWMKGVLSPKDKFEFQAKEIAALCEEHYALLQSKSKSISARIVASESCPGAVSLRGMNGDGPHGTLVAAGFKPGDVVELRVVPKAHGRPLTPHPSALSRKGRGGNEGGRRR